MLGGGSSQQLSNTGIALNKRCYLLNSPSLQKFEALYQCKSVMALLHVGNHSLHVALQVYGILFIPIGCPHNNSVT
eukprot:c31949_g1_i1 orf=1-225(-)